MPKKIIVLSVITFVLALLMAGFAWIVISVLQRMNPELNIGRQGYEPDIIEETSFCTADQVCMADPKTQTERVVPSSCADDTADVAFLESQGWIRCAAIMEE